MDKNNTKQEDNGNNNDHDKLHIFINKIKFDEKDGVKKTMSGGELADLVSVPGDNAKITRLRDRKVVTVEETIEIHIADHFEIIRKIVQAGYGK
jgi:hypothetical protein